MEESRFKSGILREPFQRWGGFFILPTAKILV